MTTVEELISSGKVTLTDLNKINRWFELTKLNFEIFNKIVDKINNLKVINKNGQKLIEIITQSSTTDKIQLLINKDVDLNNPLGLSKSIY